ncbi:head-tail connector protein [Paracoccus alkanivorans]|uniref:Phage gp6-like head-tail connector protein n=1 Tax=Paracoccus alkanivorans TaxID=2116655 RepID=A0A3M0MP63_9RHOB|nr:head-tail connector protein [Paracoccus alkanivorans]RMC37500.1 phage gp6-like head-tail connector protein [Paracoccus alkanivorans]
MSLTRVTAPSENLVPLDALKHHLRVDGSEDDDYIGALYAAAMAHIDGPRGVLGRCIQPQEWQIILPAGSTVLRYRLPLFGISNISTEWLNADGTSEPADITIDCTDPWFVISVPGTLERDLAVKMSAETSEDSWGAIRMAVMLLVGHWYLHREAVADISAAALPFSVERLLTPLKVWRV